MPLSLSTKLDCVNSILGSIGEAPVSSIDLGNLDVANADRAIDEATRELLSVGWYFNREVRELTPTGTGEYQLPLDTYSAIPTGYQNSKFVQRGNRLYNVEDSTYTGNTDKLEVTLIIPLDFDDLPQSARQVITHAATVDFAENIIGNVDLAQSARVKYQNALSLLRRDEARQERYHITNSYSGMYALDRRRF